ncbi:hypothetical protein PAAG_05931 [Paracoccidioides lutzii Pb01]|uniref:Uncharacterized protein n=1 Tax=Paracoccidioides lutzii (strain ATCC MYA-826 / Pb01) TaxID=502779 RepID=C1H590_PARBA|nr:hypothetical protein PAAG_05931 [Paracoccidioides lutzii Pb01]EEH34884.1 hypothetical protein PAAG_05931 [Paracoccidioides lutzii Pb01]
MTFDLLNSGFPSPSPPSIGVTDASFEVVAIHGTTAACEAPAMAEQATSLGFAVGESPVSAWNRALSRYRIRPVEELLLPAPNHASDPFPGGLQGFEQVSILWGWAGLGWAGLRILSIPGSEGGWDTRSRSAAMGAGVLFSLLVYSIFYSIPSIPPGKRSRVGKYSVKHIHCSHRLSGNIDIEPDVGSVQTGCLILQQRLWSLWGLHKIGPPANGNGPDSVIVDSSGVILVAVAFLEGFIVRRCCVPNSWCGETDPSP